MKEPKTLRRWRCSHSSLSTFLSCRKRYYLENWWYNIGTNLALEVGSITHVALQHHYEGVALEEVWRLVDAEVDKHEDFEFKENVENILYPLLEGYFKWYAHDPLFMQECEFKFAFSFGSHLPLYTGRCDGFGKVDEYFWIVEHKTASGTPEAVFRGFDNNRQILGYLLAGRVKYAARNPKGVMVNGLFKKTTRSRGGYARHYMMPLPWDLPRWWAETKMIIEDLVHADNQGKDAFYRNPSSCLAYGQRCPFWDYCSVGVEDMLGLHYLLQDGTRDNYAGGGDVFMISEKEALHAISTSEA